MGPTISVVLPPLHRHYLDGLYTHSMHACRGPGRSRLRVGASCSGPWHRARSHRSGRDALARPTSRHLWHVVRGPRLWGPRRNGAEATGRALVERPALRARRAERREPAEHSDAEHELGLVRDQGAGERRDDSQHESAEQVVADPSAPFQTGDEVRDDQGDPGRQDVRPGVGLHALVVHHQRHDRRHDDPRNAVQPRPR